MEVRILKYLIITLIHIFGAFPATDQSLVEENSNSTSDFVVSATLYLNKTSNCCSPGISTGRDENQEMNTTDKNNSLYTSESVTTITNLNPHIDSNQTIAYEQDYNEENVTTVEDINYIPDGELRDVSMETENKQSEILHEEETTNTEQTSTQSSETEEGILQDNTTNDFVIEQTTATVLNIEYEELQNDINERKEEQSTIQYPLTPAYEFTTLGEGTNENYTETINYVTNPLTPAYEFTTLGEGTNENYTETINYVTNPTDFENETVVSENSYFLFTTIPALRDKENEVTITDVIKNGSNDNYVDKEFTTNTEETFTESFQTEDSTSYENVTNNFMNTNNDFLTEHTTVLDNEELKDDINERKNNKPTTEYAVTTEYAFTTIFEGPKTGNEHNTDAIKYATDKGEVDTNFTYEEVTTNTHQTTPESPPTQESMSYDRLYDNLTHHHVDAGVETQIDSSIFNITNVEPDVSKGEQSSTVYVEVTTLFEETTVTTENVAYLTTPMPIFENESSENPNVSSYSSLNPTDNETYTIRSSELNPELFTSNPLSPEHVNENIIENRIDDDIETSSKLYTSRPLIEPTQPTVLENNHTSSSEADVKIPSRILSVEENQIATNKKVDIGKDFKKKHTTKKGNKKCKRVRTKPNKTQDDNSGLGFVWPEYFITKSEQC